MELLISEPDILAATSLYEEQFSVILIILWLSEMFNN